MASHHKGEEIAFVIEGEDTLLRLKNSELYLGEERVGALAIDTAGNQPQLEFALPNRRLWVKPARISDSALFIKLATEAVPSTYKAPPRGEAALNRAFVWRVVLLGGNGWAVGVFDSGLLMGYPLVEFLSTVAGIILALWVFLRPFYCSGSFRVSGTRGNVLINLTSSCGGSVSEH